METEAKDYAEIKVSLCSQILNQTKWAKDMIASVIAQTHKNWELIIVDDGSTEDLKGLVESFADQRIIYHRFEENKGVPFGTNWALKKATGKYICLIAADEIIAKTKLSEQISYLEENPKVDCVWGLPGNGDDNFPMGHRPEWEQYFLQSHNRSKYAWLRTLLNLEQVPIGGVGLMMKKSVMDELGGLDETLRTFSDHELYCRFFEKYTGVIVPVRWAIDRPFAENTGAVRVKHADRFMQEIAYVRAKHPIVPPPQEGRICVGISNYNYTHWLKEAVESVLAQTHPVDEILIFDDCSKDQEEFDRVALELKTMAPEKIRIMKGDENRGNSVCMNHMAFTTDCDWFISMAADDKLHPDYVKKCYAEFVKDPWIEFCSTHTDFFTDRDSKIRWEDTDLHKIAKPVNQPTRHEWLKIMRYGNMYFGAGMYRTYAIREVGGWEQEYKVLADYQMYLKLLQRENIKVIEENLTHTRVHGKNYSLLSKERHKELPWLYHAAKERFFPQMTKVIIATPFYEVKAFSPYICSLVATIRLLEHFGIQWGFMEISGDSYVHRARNTICDHFLEDPENTDLFFVDSDMSWNPEAFVKMVLLPYDVVGGTYPVKNKWEAWTSIPKMVEEDGMQVMKGVHLENDNSALIDAQVLAGGFLRIKRRVLEKYRKHYPNLTYKEASTRPEEPERRYTKFFAAESLEDGVFYGEDHYFSKRLRDMGTQMFIYPNVNMTHWGYKAFEGNFDTFLKAKKQEAEKAKLVESQAVQ